MGPRELHAKFRELVRTDPHRDHSEWLRERIAQLSSADDRKTVEVFLLHELQRTQQFAAAEKLLRMDVANCPEDAYPLIALAEHFHYYVGDLRKAKRLIFRAVEKAWATRQFVYQSLGVQARLAIESADWKLLARALSALTAYRHRTGNADVFPEGDFLARIPSGAAPSEVVEAYVRRRSYLSSIGYSTLTGRSTGRAGTRLVVGPHRRSPPVN